MSQKPNASAPADEATIRQLIADGKSRTALEAAKEFHKAQHTGASESLLLDAYEARIQGLFDQNLVVEGKSLVAIARERFPASEARFDRFEAAVAARGGDLAGLLQPLFDPKLDADRRAEIERIIQTQVTDLGALAGCAALPLEHSLRRAAAALDAAFKLATSGLVTDEQIALPEVSHRSPLAPWKLLVRAIACFHRGEDETCREYLKTIHPESVPSRLVPSLRAMLGGSSGALKPAEAALVSHTRVNLSPLRDALADLDRSFARSDQESRFFKAVRAAVHECQRSAPDRLGKLKQIVTVRCLVEVMDTERMAAALEGACRKDAVFFRMYAQALERSGSPEDIREACEVWEEFRQQALRENWFAAYGLEEAALYLHMANLLDRIADSMLSHYQLSGDEGRRRAPGSRDFLFPERLYARACAIDPQPEAFSSWMSWATRKSILEGEDVARAWHQALPGDIDPLLYLMGLAEKRKAFPTALTLLGKAERIDAVHPIVRAARLRLLAASAIHDLQKKKPHLAKEKLARMAELPQSQQGDRPAFLAVLRYLLFTESADLAGAAVARLEGERQLGGALAFGILLFGVASLTKKVALGFPPNVRDLSSRERMAIPACLARVVLLVKDLGIAKFPLPVPYFAETEKQFPKVSESLEIEQLRALGELGLRIERPRLTWAVSGAGLKRGGAHEATFLLLRARAAPLEVSTRSMALAAAAVELGKFHRDAEVVNEAIEIVRNPLGGDPISITLEQAREVVRMELNSPRFPDRFSEGPDYSAILPRGECDCPECRRRRAGAGLFDDFDEDPEDDFYGDLDENDYGELNEDAMRQVFDSSLPPGIAPDDAEMMFKIMKKSFLSGKSTEEIMEAMFGGIGKKAKAKKGTRKK